MEHRARSLVVTNRAALSNLIRGVLWESGLMLPMGVARLGAQLQQILAVVDQRAVGVCSRGLAGLLEQFHELCRLLKTHSLFDPRQVLGCPGTHAFGCSTLLTRQQLDIRMRVRN
jgi:transposase